MPDAGLEFAGVERVVERIAWKFPGLGCSCGTFVWYRVQVADPKLGSMLLVSGRSSSSGTCVIARTKIVYLVKVSGACVRP